MRGVACAPGEMTGERASGRQVLQRMVNEHLRTVLPYQQGDELLILCECGGPDCGRLITISSGVYGEARRRQGQFVVLNGHEVPETDRIRRRYDQFAIVEVAIDEDARPSSPH